jgi:GntR family transcriptional regulator
MFINAGARNLLMQAERQKFLAEQWPRIYATIQRLGLTLEDLPRTFPSPSSDPSNGDEKNDSRSKETNS